MKLSVIKIISPYALLVLTVMNSPANAQGRIISGDPSAQGLIAVPAELDSDAALMSQDSSDALRQYWTPERLRDATPVPLPRKETVTSDDGKRSSKTSSRLFTIKPTYPDADKPVEGYTSTTVSLNTQGLRWNGEKTLAARINGKLWFSDKDGNRYVCSASTVASAGKSLIATASHCVRNKKGYFTNFLFIPAFSQKNGTAAPYGEWTANEIFSANNEGHSSGNDVSFISLKSDKNGMKIEDLTGASGLFFNISPNLAEKLSFRFGYPGNHDGGQELTYCYTKGKYEKDFLRHYCNMTGGSSGGPVVTDFPQNGYSYGHTFGVTSVSYGGTPALTGLALFGDVEQRTYQRAGRLSPEIYIEDGYIKIKNAYHDNDSIWYAYNPLSGHYPLGVAAQMKISDIISPGEDKKYLKDGDVIYVYAQTTSTQADFTMGEMVKSKLVEVKIK